MAAACRSVVKQVYGLLSRSTRTRFKRELEDLLGVEILVPSNSQHAGAVGIATIVSGV